MFKTQLWAALTASVLSTAAFAEEHHHGPHWAYDGAEGPGTLE